MRILLSHELSPNTPLYGDTPFVNFTPLRTMNGGDTSNTSLVSFCTHSGTHVDVPYHFSINGKNLSQFQIDDFIFESPAFIFCPKSPNELITREDLVAHEKLLRVADILLVCTGFSRFRQSDMYKTQNPGLAPEAAEYLVGSFPKIRAFGIDCISISSFQNRELGRKTHTILLGRENSNFLIFEDLNLHENLPQLDRVFAIPLFFQNLDGSPVTIWGENRDA